MHKAKFNWESTKRNLNDFTFIHRLLPLPDKAMLKIKLIYFRIFSLPVKFLSDISQDKEWVTTYIHIFQLHLDQNCDYDSSEGK